MLMLINRRTTETPAYNQQPIPFTLGKFKAPLLAYGENLLGYRDKYDEDLGKDRRRHRYGRKV
jgi:hypothetical protein